MRKIIFALCFIGGLIGCKTTKSSNELGGCKHKLKTQLNSLASLMTTHEDGTYTVNYMPIKVPNGFDTIKWQTEVEILTNLDSLHTRNMILREGLKSLVSNDESCKLGKNDFIEAIGTPTEHSEAYNHFTYWFNNEANPNCYNKNPKGQHTKCSLLQFSFDYDDKLEKVSTIFLSP